MVEQTSDYITVRSAAELLGVHENTVRNWVRAGFLTDVRVPASATIRLSRAEVEERAATRGTPRVRSALSNRMAAMCHLLESDGEMTPVATRQIMRVVAEYVGP